MDATFSALVRDDAVATVGRSSVTVQKKCWRGRRRFPSSSSALIGTAYSGRPQWEKLFPPRETHADEK